MLVEETALELPLRHDLPAAADVVAIGTAGAGDRMDHLKLNCSLNN